MSNNPSDSLHSLQSYQRSRLRTPLPPLLAAFHDVDCSSTATKESFLWAQNHVSQSSTWSAWFRWSCCPSSQWQIQPRRWGQTSHAWILVQYSTLSKKIWNFYENQHLCSFCSKDMSDLRSRSLLSSLLDLPPPPPVDLRAKSAIASNGELRVDDTCVYLDFSHVYYDDDAPWTCLSWWCNWIPPKKSISIT